MLFSCKGKDIEDTQLDNESNKNELPLWGEIKLTKKVYLAGEEIQGTITSSLQANDLHLFAFSFGKYYTLDFKNSSKEMGFKIEEKITKKSGILQILLYEADDLIAHKTINIKALNGDKLIENYTGPKTIQLGSDQEAMVVVIPKDKFNNPVMEDNSVNFNYKYPDAIGSETKKTDNLIALKTLGHGKTIGKILVGANAENAFSRETEIRVTSAWPENFVITLIEHYPFADGRQFYKISSEEIRDNFGNLVTNGTRIDYIVSNGKESLAKYVSYTIGGRATVLIQNPIEETNVKIYAQCGASMSNVIEIQFKKSVVDFDITWDNSKQELNLGPIYGLLNQFISDGSKVELELDQKLLKSSETINGRANFSLDNLTEGVHSATIKVGGLVKVFQWNVRKDENSINKK